VAKALGRLGENVVALLQLPFNGTEKFFFVYILLSFAAGAIALARRPAGGVRSLRDLAAALFPASHYRHRSTRLDIAIVLINRIFTPSVIITRLYTIAGVASGVTALMVYGFGPQDSIALEGGAGLLLFTLALALITDLADYVQHAAHHRIPLLWEFHKLHHSAEVLTPLTALRTHPMEQIVGSFVEVSLIGLFAGIAGYFLLEVPEPITFLGVQLFVLFFHCCCAVHLRHSHIWLSWPGWLSRILISPAQHQIHHSKAPRHWNRNYGNILAVWDWMFGSLYVPEHQEELSFGLPDGAPHPTILAAYVVPITGAATILARTLHRAEAAPAPPPHSTAPAEPMSDSFGGRR
jgi:sterol desaturase/sphingolipid hydroxylase (fatty acid hydroxylase superfamily)